MFVLPPPDRCHRTARRDLCSHSREPGSSRRGSPTVAGTRETGVTGRGESAKLTGWTAEEWWAEHLFKTAATGGEWKNLELATVELPAGVMRFELRAEEDSWNGGTDLRIIPVTPLTPVSP
ncbi:MAG: hypothetical protein JHD33_10880 [Chthoniobacterales bacterium]|nr:hypothetical protein [Chthoniobacterales bacterium]